MAKQTKRPAFVRIQSSVNIHVNPGLRFRDVTNPNANVPERLKVIPLWQKCVVEIKTGAHWYPSEIADWSGVKALERDGVLTIGEFSDTCEEDGTQEVKDVVNKKMKEIEEKETKKEEPAKATSLEDIAGE